MLEKQITDGQAPKKVKNNGISLQVEEEIMIPLLQKGKLVVEEGEFPEF